MQIYDPPSGWLYGFPKPYKPLPGETLEQTLLRDGYPQHEIDNGGAKHVRFWDSRPQAEDLKQVKGGKKCLVKAAEKGRKRS